MKEFNVFIAGTWVHNSVYKANSREEAIEMALQDVEAEEETFTFPLEITKQCLYEEVEREESRSAFILLRGLMSIRDN